MKTYYIKFLFRKVNKTKFFEFIKRDEKIIHKKISFNYLRTITPVQFYRRGNKWKVAMLSTHSKPFFNYKHVTQQESKHSFSSNFSEGNELTATNKASNENLYNQLTGFWKIQAANIFCCQHHIFEKLCGKTCWIDQVFRSAHWLYIELNISHLSFHKNFVEIHFHNM